MAKVEKLEKANKDGFKYEITVQYRKAKKTEHYIAKTLKDARELCAMNGWAFNYSPVHF